MKNISLLLLCLALTQTAPAQKTTTDAAAEYAAVDKKALEIPPSQTNTTKDVAKYINTNFSTQKDKVRAIFIWTASSFEYDVANMYALNYYQTQQERIDKVMKLRKGICENYAAVFDDLCRKCGLTSYLIGGYTRYNGQMADLAHVWCGTIINNEYYIFDPTWGSGYVNNGKFTRHINNEYFMQPPANLIQSHLPFDPMWQLLNHPITAEDFADGKTEPNKSTPFFSYPDSIAAYEKLTTLQKFEDEARRMEQNGIKTTIAYNYFANLKRNIEVEKHTNLVAIYNSAITDFNGCIRDLNNFINYRNKQFTPAKPDAAIQGMIDTVENGMKRVLSKMNSIKGKDAKTDELIIPFLQNYAEANENVNEHKEFVKKYLSKNKLSRKAMFYKQL